ncbi:hypothetical protein [Wukongibacter sp. M2B1]|uniref:hypothetical protein n=1 Tax=Wukongibacter sp. M2B1 TaxID=3088895 RepID=UPI003D7A00CD
MNENSKRQHVVPATYLRHWAQNEIIEFVTLSNGEVDKQNMYTFNRKYQFYTLNINTRY